MRINLLIIFLGFVMLNLPAYSQVDSVRVKQCIYDSNVYPDIKSPNAILLTSLFEKSTIAVYAFRQRGPHNLNRLVFMENGKCEIINKDSSSLYIKEATNEFARKNELKSKEKKILLKKVQEYIIDFKESNYFRYN